MSHDFAGEKIGHGYVLGQRATAYEEIRRARKRHECEGCSVDADAVGPGVMLSPGTGSIVFEGWSDDCTKFIEPGQLYVAQDYVGEHAQDLGAAYRYTFRTCLACAIHFGTVVPPPPVPS